jgi:hypothetical protein
LPHVDAEPEAKRLARARLRRHVSAKYVPPQTDDELTRPRASHESRERYFLIRITNSMKADGRLAPSSLLSTRVWTIWSRSIVTYSRRSTPGLTTRSFGSRTGSTYLTLALGYSNAHYLFLSHLVRHWARPGWLYSNVRHYTAWMTRLNKCVLFQTGKRELMSRRFA